MRRKLLLMFGAFAMMTSNVLSAKTLEKVSETRNLSGFSNIEMSSVGAVYFTQGDSYSFRIEGDKKFVENTATKVKDGCLKITSIEKITTRGTNNGVKIYITAPDLDYLVLSGVGSFVCDDKLELDDIEFELKGVGSLEISDLRCQSVDVSLKGVGSAELNVDCDMINGEVKGVGSLEVSGKAGKANFKKSGIGSIDRDDLKIGSR